MGRIAGSIGIALVGTLLLTCAGCTQDLSGFTLFEFSQLAVSDDYRYPDILWARIRKTGDSQYRLQVALVVPDAESGNVLPERDLTAEEVQRMLDVFSQVDFWYDFTSETYTRDVFAPLFRWDSLQSQPGNTVDVISADSQTAVVTLLRQFAGTLPPPIL